MKTFVRVEGRRVIAYDVIGSGPLLVCVPGGPGYGGDQLARLGGLSASRSLLRVDLRGAGASDAPDEPASWSYADYANDLETLRRHLDVPRIDVFGHAHGALSAASYAQRYPDHVGAVVIDGAPIRAVEEFDTGTEAGVSDYFDDYDSRAAHYVNEHMGRIHEPAMAWFWDNEAAADFRALVAATQAPTFLVSGEHDPMAGRDAVRAMAARMPHAEWAVIPRASHFAWVENPGAYADAVETFLAQPVHV